MISKILESKFIEWFIKVCIVVGFLILSSYYIIRVSFNILEPDLLTAIIVVSVNVISSAMLTFFVTKYLSNRAYTKSQKKHAQTTMRYVRDNLGILAKAMTKVNEMIHLSKISSADIQILVSVKEKIQISRELLLNSLKDIRDIVSEEIIEDKETIENIFTSQNQMIDVIEEKQKLQKVYDELQTEHENLNENYKDTKEIVKKDSETKKGLKMDKSILIDKLKEVELKLTVSTGKLSENEERLTEKNLQIDRLNSELSDTTKSLHYDKYIGLTGNSFENTLNNKYEKSNNVILTGYDKSYLGAIDSQSESYVRLISKDSPINLNSNNANSLSNMNIYRADSKIKS